VLLVLNVTPGYHVGKHELQLDNDSSLKLLNYFIIRIISKNPHVNLDNFLTKPPY